MKTDSVRFIGRLADSKGGCSGNVIAYKCAYDANTSASTTAGMDISLSHGPHNMMNLVEGNITECVGSDGYFGSPSHITIARNWLTARHPTATEAGDECGETDEQYKRHPLGLADGYFPICISSHADRISRPTAAQARRKPNTSSR